MVLAAAIVAAVWYLRAQWALSARGRRWSGKRTLSFMAGLVAIVIALQSPVATFTMEYFQAHVIQHLLLMVIAPPLLAMGAPMTLALQTSSRSGKVRLLAVLNSRPFEVLTHPLPVWFLYYFSMFAFFLTFALNFAMEHMWVMDLVNLGFLFASTLFWWPIVGLDPVPHWKMSHGVRMANLLIGVPLESFLALALLSDHPPGGVHVHAEQHPLGRRHPVGRRRALHLPGPDPGVRPVGPLRGAQDRPGGRPAGRRAGGQRVPGPSRWSIRRRRIAGRWPTRSGRWLRKRVPGRRCRCREWSGAS